MLSTPHPKEETIISVRSAEPEDIPICKAIADAHRDALGFIMKAVFADAIRRHQLMVADRAGEVVGFVRYNHRIRGYETALYDICVAPSMQRQGVGRRLVEQLCASCRQHGRCAIVLRCPEGLPANTFYAHLGFQQVAIEPGRRRSLVIWRLML